MRLLRCAPSHLGQLTAFLAPHGKSCVSFIERVEGFPESCGGGCFLLQDGSGACGAIFGALLFSRNGVMFHCLPAARDEGFRKEAAPLLERLFAGRSFYCIPGDLPGTRFLGELRKKSAPGEIREMYLLEYAPGERTAEEAASGGSPEIVRCGPEQAEALFPLRRAYEKKEVYPQGFPFSERLMRENLMRSLEKGRVFGIAGPGKPSAKREEFAAMAVVNAETRAFIQIGGMFTAPEFRARGYARALAGGLAQRARARGCGAVLYAGVENVPALRAYERAGFVTLGGYGIAYFFPRKIDRKIGM